MTEEAKDYKGWGPFKKKPNILIILTDQQRSIQLWLAKTSLTTLLEENYAKPQNWPVID